jgi:hypothetical protein
VGSWIVRFASFFSDLLDSLGRHLQSTTAKINYTSLRIAE